MTLHLRGIPPANPFFLAHGDFTREPPRRGYFRLDQTEPIEAEAADEAVFSFEGVDADWLDRSELEPQAYWAQLHEFSGWARSGDDRPEFVPDDIYAEIPIYRLEVSCSDKDQTFHSLREFALKDTPWITASLDPDDGFDCDIFTNLFGEAAAVPMNFRPQLDENVSASLQRWFSMSGWPSAQEDGLIEAISKNSDIEYLAVYDVGQGSANALLSSYLAPQFYYDLGCGVYRNAKTTPKPPPQFCWTESPSIVLSHWDCDHWAAAMKDRAALGQTWIAPYDDTIGPVHTGFANDILQNGGQILIWDQLPSPISFAARNGAEVVIGGCNGRDRNGSGLATVVTEQVGDTTRGWLLTGDAGYDEIPLTLPDELSAIIVPHHGADMGKRSRNIPLRPATNLQACLAYSFGPGNAHGRYGTSHPTAATVAAHQSQNWDHHSWNGVPLPGATVPGGDVRATARHTTSHLGGVLAGRLSPPPNSLAPPCSVGSRNCNVNLTQT